MSWAWLVDAPTAVGRGYPLILPRPAEEQGAVVVGTASMDRDVAKLVRGLGIPTAAPGRRAGLSLRLATANVLTLLPGRGAKEVGMGIGGRAASLAGQFSAAGLHVVGLQEARIRTEAPAQIGEYYVLVGPALPSGRL